MATRMRILRILGWTAGIVVCLLLILVIYVEMNWDAPQDRPVSDLRAPADSATIAQGEYIYKYQSLCWGCHADPSAESAADPGAFPQPSGGFLFDLRNAGPGFGLWYSRNITSDAGTGIGEWTDGEIVQALREGIAKKRTLFPIMPIDWYHGMADEDLLALAAYLRTLPPVQNKVPDNEPSLFAKALFTFGMLKPKEATTEPVIRPQREITPEYGKYLANNLAGCADCHTPRNLQNGQFYYDSLFAGSSFAYGEDEGAPMISFAGNITPDMETGIGTWSEEQFITAVTAGVLPDGSVLTTHMPYAYYKFWSPEDLKAVYAYLQTVAPIRRTVPDSRLVADLSSAQSVERGAILFKARCQACHGRNSRGAPPTNVSLAEVSASLSDAELMEFISTGEMSLNMPGFAKTLSDKEVSDVVVFIRSIETK